MYKRYTLRKEQHEVGGLLTKMLSLGRQISEDCKHSSYKIEKAYIDWSPMQWTLQHRIMLVSQGFAKELYLPRKFDTKRMERLVEPLLLSQEKSSGEKHTYRWTLQFFSNGEMELEHLNDSSKSFKRRLNSRVLS